jgi:fatty acid desaturase
VAEQNPTKALEQAPVAYITEDDAVTGELTAAAVQPTQVRRPWRSTARSVFQALVGLAVIAPLVAAAVEEATGYDLDGVPFVAAVLAGAAAVARVMAVPAVEVWLRQFLPFLAAAPKA